MLLASFCAYINRYELTNADAQLTRDPGYYIFELTGAQGGQGCTKHEVFKKGGNPAKITGIFQLKQTTALQLTAGSTPGKHCSDWPFNPPKPQHGGYYGHGGNSGDEAAGGGGGYSAIYIDWNNIIAMAGGGGGAGTRREGTPAGGIGYQLEHIQNQFCDANGWLTVSKTGTATRNDHNGQNAKTYELNTVFSGAGGGGGYFGGAGGSSYVAGNKNDKCKQPGVGGSSYVDTNRVLPNFVVLDGKQNKNTDGIGRVVITNHTICGQNCADCELNNGNKCTECLARYWLFENTCYASCSQTRTPTYKDLTLNKCVRCMDRCTKCYSGSTCEACESGYRFDGNRCVKIPPPTQTPTPPPTKTPIPPPTKTPIPPPTKSAVPVIPPQPVVPPTHEETDPQPVVPPTHEETDPQPEHNPASSPDQQPVQPDTQNPEENTTAIQSQTNTSAGAAEKGNGQGGSGQLNPDSNSPEDGSKFPWWIIAAISAGVVIIAVVIAVISCKLMKKNDDSIEMQDEDAVELRNTTNTSVTNDNPLYTSTSPREEDPFRSDFNSEAPNSSVFQQKDIEELDENNIDAPDYDF